MGTTETATMTKFAGPQARSGLQVTPVVYIVDDDVSVRESLELLIRCAGWQPVTFASAWDFLSHPLISAPSCLILDIGLPDISGLDLQQQLAERYHPPIIFLTGNGDIPTSVRAIKAGALDFLIKPFGPRPGLRASRQTDRSGQPAAALYVANAARARGSAARGQWPAQQAGRGASWH
jgi:FixJ family two-component response regulator